MQTDPAGIWPGHRASPGTRMPPSQSVRFWPRNGRLLSREELAPAFPFSKVAPLSLVKTINVFAASPRSSSRAINRPMFRSSRVTMAA